MTLPLPSCCSQCVGKTWISLFRCTSPEDGVVVKREDDLLRWYLCPETGGTSSGEGH